MSSRQEDLRYRFKSNSEDIEEVSEMPSRSRNGSQIFKIFISSVCGLVFGWALEKGRVFEPNIIRAQMLFTNFTMLKIFFSASATGMFAFSLMTMIPASSRKMDEAINEFLVAIRYRTMAGAVIGALLLGTGMTLAGACPGMVLVQVGAQVPNANLTIVGCLLGVYLYALSYQILPSFLRSRQAIEHSKLDEAMECSYVSLALPFASIMGLMVVAVELIFPWTSEVNQSGTGILGSKAWPPFVSGMLIGCLQIPIVLTISDTLGSSTGFVTVASQILTLAPLNQPLAYLKGFSRGMINWWQVFYVGAAIFGANMSARASDTIGTVSGVGPLEAISGGVLMLYGSRLAGGCTSGHGLSGMGLLVLMSFVAVPAMFSGGIATAFLLKYGLGVDI